MKIQIAKKMISKMKLNILRMNLLNEQTKKRKLKSLLMALTSRVKTWMMKGYQK